MGVCINMTNKNIENGANKAIKKGFIVKSIKSISNFGWVLLIA
jgi:hypothetical protein